MLEGLTGDLIKQMSLTITTEKDNCKREEDVI
jgi:hypothetical protein